MTIALACSTVTIAHGGYAGVLTTAIACAALAVLCLAVPIARGPLGWRVAGVVLALPALFVVSDFIRRAPNVFGGGGSVGRERKHDGKTLLLDWRDARSSVVFRVTEAPGTIVKQNSRLHVERNGSDRAVLIDDDAIFSTIAFVRHDHWLLVVCRGVDEVWAGYDYDAGQLYDEHDWEKLPLTKWSGQ